MMEDFQRTCLPYTPCMSRFHSRLATFNLWPGHIRATPTQIAEAGFYYLNERDRTKCFHCNGGLQHWHEYDDPWFEHAKWFPRCEYLRHCKGDAYVNSVARQFPHLKRPDIYISSKLCLSQNVPAPTDMQVVVADSTGPAREEDALSLDERLAAAMEGEVARDAVAICFGDEDIVREVVRRKLTADGAEYDSVLKLVEECQKEEQCDTSSTASSTLTSSSISNINSHLPVAVSSHPTSLRESRDATDASFCVGNTELSRSGVPAGPSVLSHSNAVEKVTRTNHNFKSDEVGSGTGETSYQTLLDEQTCKVCLDRRINCLLMPCRHLCCCVQCGPALKSCPLCRTRLEKLMIIYRSNEE